jgi:hypothetical protein
MVGDQGRGDYGQRFKDTIAGSSKVTVAGAEEATPQWPGGHHQVDGREDFGVNRLPSAHAHELLIVSSGNARELASGGPMGCDPQGSW